MVVGGGERRTDVERRTRKRVTINDCEMRI